MCVGGLIVIKDTEVDNSEVGVHENIQDCAAVIRGCDSFCSESPVKL